MFAKLVYKFVLPNLQMLNALLKPTHKRASESEKGGKIHTNAFEDSWRKRDSNVL